MKILLAFCVSALFGAAGLAQGKESFDRSAIDPIYFLAGLSVVGAEMDYISPPQCESFFREGGDLRAAELFIDVARHLKGTTTHYYDPSGKRLVVINASLSKTLRAFYALPNGVGSSELALLRLDRPKRLSFLAGIYARRFREGAFHGSPSPAMFGTVLMLLAEGCQVSRFTLSEGEVPETIHFHVKPSESIAQLFKMVDHWQPPHAQWKSK